jgi:hypothetical protein
MIEDESLGLKIAENSDEKFWTETLEKCKEGIKSAERNIKLDKKMIELCEQELKK